MPAVTSSPGREGLGTVNVRPVSPGLAESVNSTSQTGTWGAGLTYRVKSVGIDRDLGIGHNYEGPNSAYQINGKLGVFDRKLGSGHSIFYCYFDIS